MSRSCAWCSGVCAGAELGPLLAPEMQWLWEQIATAADRRGDPESSAGSLHVVAPSSPEERAATVGLLGGPLRAGQRRSVDLAQLTARLQPRGAHLTPGAVAAHAVGRPLAVRAAGREARRRETDLLHEELNRVLTQLPPHVAERVGTDTAWERLSRAGVVARLAGRADAMALLRRASSVLLALPDRGRRVDRRTLVPGAPHALDEGEPLAWLVLAIVGQGGQRRHAWHALGVDFDDLTGGLLTLGIQPAGWVVPDGAVLTLPPRELTAIRWPAPSRGRRWVFVTENPSVVAAAADRTRPGRDTAQLLCTMGTPSAVEVAAVAALAKAGWRVAVRADFDPAGLFHVRMLLAACPAAVPWRMDTTTYLDAGRCFTGGESLAVNENDTPWDPTLGPAMADSGVVVFEEDVLDLLLRDVHDDQVPNSGDDV